jgi:hypothetical protein
MLQNMGTERMMPRAEFLERNYIHYNVPAVGPAINTPLLFEAQVAPHLFFYNGLNKVESNTRCDRFLQAVSLSFILRIRMVGDTSSPVRPPSYIPRLNYQAFWFFKNTPARIKKKEGRFGGQGTLTMVGLRASLGHHSNGQQYCRFDENRRIPDEDDTSAPPCPSGDVDSLNVRSGDFSTDFIQLAGHLAYLILDEDSFEQRRWGVGLVGETNPQWLDFLPGAIDAEEYATYGPHRLRLELAYTEHLSAPKRLPAMLSVDIGLEGFSKTAPGVARYRVQAQAAYVPDRLGGIGLFARFTSGQDYLNILYLRPAIHTVQLGVIWDLSPRLAYRFRPGHRPSPQAAPAPGNAPLSR